MFPLEGNERLVDVSSITNQAFPMVLFTWFTNIQHKNIDK
ncbi:hypothetical protein PPIS_a1888 [Pseudoalteromonas piscicida]|uniref:Uncharacterized protein n=1 Tax=Pseudoalteromonas piscicida TaxID=43662 RepID=A0ABM6NDH9_PSEO7|nr:hypothetical protein PPIS_a1888 [Pseudoalteromonas piscicida]